MNLEDKWRAEYCVDNNCTDMESRFDPCLVPEWSGYLKGRRKAQEEIDKINSDYSLIMKSYCVNNDLKWNQHIADMTKVQDMHDELLKLVKFANPYILWLLMRSEGIWSQEQQDEMKEWLKEVGEIICLRNN